MTLQHDIMYSVRGDNKQVSVRHAPCMDRESTLINISINQQIRMFVNSPSNLAYYMLCFFWFASVCNHVNSQYYIQVGWQSHILCKSCSMSSKVMQTLSDGTIPMTVRLGIHVLKSVICLHTKKQKNKKTCVIKQKQTLSCLSYFYR